VIKIREIKAKSILNPSKLGCDYAINPYNGCAFGCAYCYAIFMNRMGHQNENWGEWVDVRIKTYAFVGPLLPHLAQNPKELEKLFRSLKEAGVEDIWVEHINLSPYIKNRLYLFILKNLPDQLVKFKMAENPKYQEKLNKILNEILSKIKFKTQRIIRK
jgi:DNA repair photolyase